MTDPNNDQQEFAKSLSDHVQKAIANNPPLLRMRSVNQALVAEVRRRLQGGVQVHLLAAVADESRNVSFIETEGKVSDLLLQKLRKPEVFAASLCTLVKRVSPTGGQPILFIQMHTEDKSGLAVLTGVPVDEKENTAGLSGVTGAAVARYAKKVSPIIFAVTK